jgi:hypothetical protein
VTGGENVDMAEMWKAGSSRLQEGAKRREDFGANFRNCKPKNIKTIARMTYVIWSPTLCHVPESWTLMTLHNIRV